MLTKYGFIIREIMTQVVMIVLRRQYMRKRERVIGLIGRTRKNPDVLENPPDHQIKDRLRGSVHLKRRGVWHGPETRFKDSGGHSAAEERLVRSRKKTTVRPCPYYLRSLFKEPEGPPEEQMSMGIDSLPQNSLRRRSLSMGAVDGDPADRST
ncbi:uncharacterized protein TNCV_2502571 [Trichonephila clavipes]|nr:uncharacterized protein TNCV_2502571 [Trichonephila clavipes]